MKAIMIALALTSAASAASAGETLLEDGAYKIEVRLELPHLEDLNYKTETTICLTSKENGDNHGFRILSGNNPLRTCAAHNIHQDGESLTFDIGCQSTSNLAKGRATYTLSSHAFRGRIDMTMAGKNMTMSEIQEGRRVGACKGSEGRS